MFSPSCHSKPVGTHKKIEILKKVSTVLFIQWKSQKWKNKIKKISRFGDFFFSFWINCPFKQFAFIYQLWYSHNNLQLLTYMICIYNKQYNKYLKSFKKWNKLCSVWVMLILNQCVLTDFWVYELNQFRPDQSDSQMNHSII